MPEILLVCKILTSRGIGIQYGTWWKQNEQILFISAGNNAINFLWQVIFVSDNEVSCSLLETSAGDKKHDPSVSAQYLYDKSRNMILIWIGFSMDIPSTKELFIWKCDCDYFQVIEYFIQWVLRWNWI